MKEQPQHPMVLFIDALNYMARSAVQYRCTMIFEPSGPNGSFRLQPYPLLRFHGLPNAAND